MRRVFSENSISRHLIKTCRNGAARPADGRTHAPLASRRPHWRRLSAMLRGNRPFTISHEWGAKSGAERGAWGARRHGPGHALAFV
jgi:hypothetical protein